MELPEARAVQAQSEWLKIFRPTAGHIDGCDGSGTIHHRSLLACMQAVMALGRKGIAIQRYKVLVK